MSQEQPRTDSAAARNVERGGAVTHDQDQLSNLARNQGVTIWEEHTNEGPGNPLAGQGVGQLVEDDVANNKKGAMNIDNEIVPNMDADAPVTMQAPQVKANTQDQYHDFIISSDPTTTTLNPRLSLSGSNQHDNTLSNVVSTDNRETRSENPNVVITSVPGGMGASMATADQRLTKNK